MSKDDTDIQTKVGEIEELNESLRNRVKCIVYNILVNLGPTCLFIILLKKLYSDRI